jgi:hypothetical protein
VLALAGVLASGIRSSDAADRCADPTTASRASSVETAPSEIDAALRTPPPAPTPAPRKLSMNGQKFGGVPFSKRTEAGLSWALDSRVSIQLNYARTTHAPMMPFDHDDGIMTRLRVGF